MDLTRQLSRNDYLRLKDASRRLIKRAGGLHKAAEVTRLGTTRLADCCSVADLSASLPIDVVADLESYVGEPIVSLALAEFACNPSEPHRPMDRMHRMQMLVKECSEAAVEIGNGDSHAALKELEEAREAIEAAERDIRARMSRASIARVAQ